MKKAYFTIDKEYESVTVIERSKFICRIKPISDEKSAKNYLTEIIKKETGATHNCYASVLEGETVFKFSDDGEPHGTAGQPMLEVLKGNGLKNVMAVVTRYFGGIKLGTGGLVRAYSGAVSECVKKAEIIEKVYSSIISVTVDYNLYPKIPKTFSKSGGKVISTDFGNEVNVVFAVPVDNKEILEDELSSVLNGNIKFVENSCEYIAYSR